MTAIIIGIIIYLIYKAYSKKKQTYSNDNQKYEVEIRDDLDQIFFNKRGVSVTASIYQNDSSIIDITEDYNLTIPNSFLKKHIGGVTYWAHQYVYSYTEIYNASPEQKRFYTIFKDNFLKGEYYDLEGNTNYAFILLFDLLKEFDIHKNSTILESQLKKLGQCYPKTKSYASSFLIKKMLANGDSDAVTRLTLESGNSYQNHYTEYDYWKLGTKYETKLKLNEEEVILLNKLWYSRNSFSSIEFCCIETLKLYLSVISHFKKNCISEGTTIDALFLSIADIILTKHYKYQKGTQNYKYNIDNTINGFYIYIFKYCENAVREYYGHKRKINTDTGYTSLEAKDEFNTKILSNISNLISTLIPNVKLPDEATEVELNSKNTNRWKIKFDELTKNYNNKPKDFVNSIVNLGVLNKKNPSVENIFFEASKFISKYHKETALSLYVRYLYHDLKSVNFDNKQLTKTIQKSLFETNEQLHNFEGIISELIKDKDLEKALKKVSLFYEVKRKKIQLDTASIKEVQQQHSGTVQLLNKYLKDDFEDENISIRSQELNDEELKIEITPKGEDVKSSAFLSELLFSSIQILALELFLKNNFSVQQLEFEVFAKSKNVFKNQLIESINETCYDILDDVLIEEEEDYYIINIKYFNKIIAQ